MNQKPCRSSRDRESKVGRQLHISFEAFAGDLRRRGYHPHTMGLYGWVVAHFGRWLLPQQAAPRQIRQALATLSLESLTPDTVLSFLNHLEENRGNTIRTRNARLAALRSFVHYLTDWLGPELPAAARRILTLPFKRQVKPLIGFLTRPEIEALLAATADQSNLRHRTGDWWVLRWLPMKARSVPFAFTVAIAVFGLATVHPVAIPLG